MLGYLIEKKSGQKYGDFIKKNIFKPLRMKHSGYDSNREIIPERATGYSTGPEGIINADYIDMSITQGT